MNATALVIPGKKSHLDRIHALLTIQSAVVVLLSINRLSSLANGYVSGNEFLRWVDFNNMLILPLVSLVAFYLLKKEIEYDHPIRESRLHLLLNIAFVTGVYWLGVGYGDHEVTKRSASIFI